MGYDCFIETYDDPDQATLKALNGSNLPLVTLDKVCCTITIKANERKQKY